MKKCLIIPFFLVLFSCGGGSDDVAAPGNTVNTPNYTGGTLDFPRSYNGVVLDVYRNGVLTVEAVSISIYPSVSNPYILHVDAVVDATGEMITTSRDFTNIFPHLYSSDDFDVSGVPGIGSSVNGEEVFIYQHYSDGSTLEILMN